MTTFRAFADSPLCLSEPLLLDPGEGCVTVVWFTTAPGENPQVCYGVDLAGKAAAITTRVDSTWEDAASHRAEKTGGLSPRPVWRHAAVVTGLRAGVRVPYLASLVIDGVEHRSTEASLQPLPAAGSRQRWLLSSDLQLKPMAAANYQKAAAHCGPFDGVLFAGDLVNVPNRASEWFDCNRDQAPPFFAALQGRVRKWQPAARFAGGEILQGSWFFPAAGNHEYMGRVPDTAAGSVSLEAWFNDTQPRWYAALRCAAGHDESTARRETWIARHSFNRDTFDALFALPAALDGPCCYARRIGDLFLIVLDVARAWRPRATVGRGKFTEDPGTLRDPNQWGFGDHPLWPIEQGSEQHAWLEAQLQRPDFRDARFRVVLAHHSVFGLGDNATPVFAQPQMWLEAEDAGATRILGPYRSPITPQDWAASIQPLIDAGRIRRVQYQYPLAADVWKRDVEPLLEAAGVQLVLSGHSHLWNRSRVGAMHYLETSNVGNSYGAAYPGFGRRERPRRQSSASPLDWDAVDYPENGDPHQRPMVFPTGAAALQALSGSAPAPFLASNEVTGFSVLDTAEGVVTSYACDTRDPDGPVLEFDCFSLL